MSARFTVGEVTAALGRAPERGTGNRRGAEVAAFGRVVIDSRRTQPGDLFVAIRGERFDGNTFLDRAVTAGASGAVGEDRPFQGRERIFFWPMPDGRRALQALAGHHRDRLGPRVVAVTGSNGKTTTKELVASVLGQRFVTAATRGNLNNQIGVPLTLLEIEPEHEWAVVELGMSLPGEIEPLARIARPEVGIVTNVAASHLEGLRTIDAVLEEKLALGRALGENGLLVYCGDQELLRNAVRELPCERISYGLAPGNDITPDDWSLDEEGRGSFLLEGRTFRLRLAGRHNVVNALAAVAVGREAGLSPGAIAGGLAEPDQLPLRMQLERWGEVLALVDCYNANPESVLSAAGTLAALGNVRRRIAVLGEMLELGERSAALHEELGRELAGAGIDLVVSVGSGAAPVVDGAARAGLAGERFGGRDEAARWLIEHLEPGDAVLFKASRGAALEKVVGVVREACLDGSVRAGC
ncbi:MAG TPA: UDP-N-acetylmuramoyl-tripeptide--D-alanyl-D-alanine ligase [Gemmatimonadota bacterium]|nr:UDP-N-acetylmuramoyl-tripeptide--D-alanyl-D-alanine ligase [Gemmatimonadota bacterium]